MSDSFLSQNPLLVMPQTLKGETDYFMRMANAAPSVDPWLSPERQEELKHLADEIAVDFPHMGRAVTFYRSLLVENPSVEPYPRIKFWATLLSLGKDGANSIWVIGCLGRSRILWELRFTGVGLVAEPKDVQCTRGVQLGGCRKSTNFFEWSSQPRRPAKLCQHHLLDLLAIQYSIPFFLAQGDPDTLPSAIWVTSKRIKTG